MMVGTGSETGVRGMGTNGVSRVGHASLGGMRGEAGHPFGEADAAVLPGRNVWTLTWRVTR